MLKRARAGFLSACIAFSFCGATAHAGATLQIDEVRSASIGAGLRTGVSLIENGAKSGEDYSKDPSLLSIRLYMGGQISEHLKVEFNTEMDTNLVRVLDAVAKYELNDYFNVWAGRFLPPSDRSNLSGPYYGNVWDFPFVQNYPAIFAGRDDGIALWGKIKGGLLKYQIGAFKGLRGPSNHKDTPLMSGRLTINLWDAEPGYYNSSTYYGSQDVLALGFVGMYQSDALGNEDIRGDLLSWSVDFLMEKNLGDAGVPTLEAAFYSYGANGISPENANSLEGTGYFVLGSYLLPGQQGIGQLQPKVRYMALVADMSGAPVDKTRWEAGLDYVISGHNSRMSFVYANETAASETTQMVKLGLQVQL